MRSSEVLDHYRLSITSDKNVFNVISNIYQSALVFENELLDQTEISDAELKLILTKLYRASLISKISENTWQTTRLADQILESIGVDDIALRCIIRNQGIDDDHAVLLQTAIEISSQSNHTWKSEVFNTLRTASYALDKISKIDRLSKDLKRDVLYTLAVGSSPLASTLPVSNFCSIVRGYADKKTTPYVEFEASCEYGIKNYMESNLLSIGTSDHIEENKLLNITGSIRHFAYLMARTPMTFDTSLEKIYSISSDMKLNNIANSLSQLARYDRRLVSIDFQSNNMDSKLEGGAARDFYSPNHHYLFDNSGFNEKSTETITNEIRSTRIDLLKKINKYRSDSGWDKIRIELAFLADEVQSVIKEPPER